MRYLCTKMGVKKVPLPHNLRNNKCNEVVTKRKGGETLIENRPVFSTDAKNVYLNCSWGVKVFSIKTGECVQTVEICTAEDRVVSVLVPGETALAITEQGKLVEWNTSKGVIKMKELNIGAKSVAINAHLVPNFKKRHKKNVCIEVYDEEKKKNYLQFFSLSRGKEVTNFLSNLRVSGGKLKHKISFGGFQNTPILGSISPRKLYVHPLEETDKITKGIKPGPGRKWTCVQCHPEETVVACGDSSGRVVVYRNPLECKGPSVVYHWHTLPCRDIAFTASGSSLYTGGCENVLVKWNLENPNLKNFLPRLSGEIVHISIAPDNLYVAVSTLDNSVQIVEASHRLKCVLQQLGWGVLPVPNMKLFPAGLHFDPRTKSLVLNGRMGHLQFFCPNKEVLLFKVDVTMQNYLTQERNKRVINTEVTHTSLSSDSAWMATVETRDDPGVGLEIRLKMWHFIPSKKCFELSTSVDLPHNGLINTVKFRPGARAVPSSDQINLNYMLATTGQDKKFRLWTPIEIDSVYKRGIVWGCESVGFFRDKDCGAASFSDDGSLLAVGFGPTLTIWDMDDINLKTTLTRNSKILRFVEFGRTKACHLVVTGTETELSIWNLLTVTLMWHVQLEPLLLISDPYTSYLAVFTKDRKMYIFTPLSTEPIFISNNVCERSKEVISAVFAPRDCQLLGAPQWLQHSRLYYIDSNQELKVFETEGESADSVNQRIARDPEPGTLFSVLVNSQKVSELQNRAKPIEHLTFGVLGAKAVRELLDGPSHTMAPVSLLCNNLLRSLAMSKEVKDKNKEVETSESEAEEECEEEESDDESAEEPSDPVEGEITPKRKSKKRKDNSPNKLIPDSFWDSLKKGTAKSEFVNKEIDLMELDLLVDSESDSEMMVYE